MENRRENFPNSPKTMPARKVVAEQDFFCAPFFGYQSRNEFFNYSK